MANRWPNLMTGHRNAVAALHGELQYYDQKKQQSVGIRESGTVIFVRVRGLHLSQAGVLDDGPVAAPLFDLAMLMAAIDPARLKHPLSIYIPKSESAQGEAVPRASATDTGGTWKGDDPLAFLPRGD
jgi:malate synthase